MESELDRRREECLQLKAVLAHRAKDSIDVAKESYGGDAAILNEVRVMALGHHSLSVLFIVLCPLSRITV